MKSHQELMADLIDRMADAVVGKLLRDLRDHYGWQSYDSMDEETRDRMRTSWVDEARKVMEDFQPPPRTVAMAPAMLTDVPAVPLAPELDPHGFDVVTPFGSADGLSDDGAEMEDENDREPDNG